MLDTKARTNQSNNDVINSVGTAMRITFDSSYLNQVLINLFKKSPRNERHAIASRSLVFEGKSASQTQP